MASEIRVDKINSLSGVGTVTLSPTGVDIAGITTAATLRATTGIVTSLTAGSLTSLGAVSGTTGTFTGDVDIADKIIHTGDTNTAIRFPAADTITAETGGSERLRIGSDGKVGVNTTAGAARLTVDAASGYSIISNGNSNAIALGSNGIILFGNKNAQAYGSGGYDATEHIFKASGSEKVRILSDGDVGIGTITPQNNARLQVSTNQQVVAAFEGTGGSDPQIYLGDDMTTPTDNCIILGYDKADNRGYLTVGGDGDNVFTVKNGGDIEIGVGNLKFGTSGKGIDFSATSDGNATATSELLDDYEEGNWTPVIVGTGANPTITYASGFPRGRYIKTGATVTLWYDAAWSGLSGGSGTVYIQGFPYSTGGSFYYGGGTMVHANGTTCLLYTSPSPRDRG